MEKPVYDEKAAAKFLKPDLLAPMTQLTDAVSAMAAFTEKDLEDIFKQVMETSGLGFGKIAQPVRVALTGKTVSLGIFEMMLALGREKVVSRLRAAVAKMAQSGG
ncbi:MAG: hypothetical protein R2875_11770 [Desulfobacterales bacterium]